MNIIDLKQTHDSAKSARLAPVNIILHIYITELSPIMHSTASSTLARSFKLGRVIYIYIYISSHSAKNFLYSELVHLVQAVVAVASNTAYSKCK